MPIYRTKNGKKTTKLYLDEIKRLHWTKDLLADLVLNQPLVVAYAQAHGHLAKVCDLWPMPEPRADPTTDAGTSGPSPEDSEQSSQSSAEIAASMEAIASDPRTA